MVRVTGVEKHSAAAKKRIKSGDSLISINGNEINDVLDYRFFLQDEKLTLELTDVSGRVRSVKIKKDRFDDIGLEFETYLMDTQHRCRNKCIFCFIDQLPEGMRESLYFKDDDSRLSFLFGNYITLTNLSDGDVERIIRMHISPVNVSVHTMNPKLRVYMMKNRFAGESLRYLRQLADAGIELNIQLVICPKINDSKELEFSLSEIEKLMPSVKSIAVVPLGLTKYRENLEKLEPFDTDSAADVIRTADFFGDAFMKKYSRRVVFCADELYILAGLPVPGEAYYEDYPQIENGVGLLRSLEGEFMSALCEADGTFGGVSASLATGAAAYPLIEGLARAVENRFPETKFDIFKIDNDFFGRSITVAGLVTGGDLIAQLQGKLRFKRLIIPSVMLRDKSDVFLDGVTVTDVEKALGAKVYAAPNDGYRLLDLMLGK